MVKGRHLVLLGCLVARSVSSYAQTAGEPVGAPLTTIPVPTGTPPKDVIDLARRIFPRLPITKHDTVALLQGRKFVWVAPAVGYALQTRLLAELVTNVAFKKPGANMSTVISELIYTQNKQGILTIASSLWARDNRINWVGDWRIMHFPEDTYGLGTHTARDSPIGMMFNYLRLYQSALRKVSGNVYAGLGYQLDVHWGVRSGNGPEDLPEISGYTAGINGRSVSSGGTLNLLFDNRSNAINPPRGAYVSVILRPNWRLLGSDTNYQSLVLDVRKYLPLSNVSGNVLAFWSYSWLTLHGTPPYLDLPSTGWDTYGNLGRGFIQGRFRGRSLLYEEAEYRCGLTRNRLLGGVVFANVQSAWEEAAHRPGPFVPAVGAGVRLNVNKIARTNLAVDYGFGADGSRGLFFNLGEVF